MLTFHYESIRLIFYWVKIDKLLKRVIYLDDIKIEFYAQYNRILFMSDFIGECNTCTTSCTKDP